MLDLATLASSLGKTKRAVEIRAKREGWAFEEKATRGGRRRLYAVDALPPDVQAAAVIAGQVSETPQRAVAVRQANVDSIASAWKRYEAVPQHLKDEAARRLRALQAVEALQAAGHPLMAARQIVASQMQRDQVGGVSVASLGRWAALVAKAEKQHRLALLVPAYAATKAKAEIHAEAWDLFKADYLRVEAPSAQSCYDRLQRIAATRIGPHFRAPRRSSAVLRQNCRAPSW